MNCQRCQFRSFRRKSVEIMLRDSYIRVICHKRKALQKYTYIFLRRKCESLTQIYYNIAWKTPKLPQKSLKQSSKNPKYCIIWAVIGAVEMASMQIQICIVSKCSNKSGPDIETDQGGASGFFVGLNLFAMSRNRRRRW